MVPSIRRLHFFLTLFSVQECLRVPYAKARRICTPSPTSNARQPFTIISPLPKLFLRLQVSAKLVFATANGGNCTTAVTWPWSNLNTLLPQPLVSLQCFNSPTMPTNVTVITADANRAVVKVTPSTYISDILQQACQKLALNADNYHLKCVSFPPTPCSGPGRQANHQI